eukprot:24291-Eustigmatos_ZCMA.PRE.1
MAVTGVQLQHAHASEGTAHNIARRHRRTSAPTQHTPLSATKMTGADIGVQRQIVTRTDRQTVMQSHRHA